MWTSPLLVPVASGCIGVTLPFREPLMPQVTLVALTPEEQHAFVAEHVADYAAWLVEHGEITDPAVAHTRARAEIVATRRPHHRSGSWLHVHRLS
jgi:hypothetical protein